VRVEGGKRIVLREGGRRAEQVPGQAVGEGDGLARRRLRVPGDARRMQAAGHRGDERAVSLRVQGREGRVADRAGAEGEADAQRRLADGVEREQLEEDDPGRWCLPPLIRTCSTTEPRAHGPHVIRVAMRPAGRRVAFRLP
jgi:hypothetical protein